jgi:hypothetical protein
MVRLRETLRVVDHRHEHRGDHQAFSTGPNDSADCRDGLTAHLDERPSDHPVRSQRLPVEREQMRFADVAGLQRPREHFRVDAICLAPA